MFLQVYYTDMRNVYFSLQSVRRLSQFNKAISLSPRDLFALDRLVAAKGTFSHIPMLIICGHQLTISILIKLLGLLCKYRCLFLTTHHVISSQLLKAHRNHPIFHRAHTLDMYETNSNYYGVSIDNHFLQWTHSKVLQH